ADTALRLWRNTGMTGNTTLTAGTLGYEIDWEQAAYASWYPAGRITFSETTVNTSNTPAGPKTHKISLYRATSGALVLGSGTAQWSWGLDSHHDRTASSEDPRIQQATVNILSDMGAQPATIQTGMVPGGPLDTTAPTATITSPTGGETVPGGNVTISGTAADTVGVVAAVEVSTDGGATWAHATGTTSWTYTFTAINGPVTVQARAVDDAANIGTPVSVSLTAAPQACPCSIFGSAVTGTEESDSTAGELGVKFRSDVAGFVTGIRFYKTTGNTGAHTGTLWSTTGANLATVTFSGESATGWQEAIFDSPVAIDAGVTYVASYHTSSGRYATGTSFVAAGVDSPPLHALTGGLDGPNGVYMYGPGGTYPTDSFGSSNYLVDVVFQNSVGPDTTPPTISGRSPASAVIGVAVGADVTATFNEAMLSTSFTGSTVELRGPSNTLVPATVSYTASTRTAVLDPAGSLEYSTAYLATVKGGSGGVTDVAGNALVADITWTFTTAAPPPPQPSEGPGGPILVVSSAANPFSRYYTEILRNEGLNAFNAVDITSVDPTLLAAYEVVILGEVSIDPTQASMFATWVDGGGNLIAMRPDPDLANLLGLTASGTNLSDAYLQIDTGAGKPGAGLVSQTIQFHGTADRYALDAGTVALASLYSDASTSTGNAAVTLRSVGTKGGQAAAFTYDLAKSVVYTRQGNPDQAGKETDGQQPPIMRSDDLFFPDWVDFNKIQIPQADEQQRLLANLIEQVNRDQMPLPRFWYFPRGEKAVVVMTGDDHASGGTSGQFDWDIAQSPANCNIVEWECVRGTSYIYPNTPITNTAAAAYQAQGFEVSIHVQTDCTDWTPPMLEAFYDDQLAAWKANFPSLNSPATHRTHCITWSDWATQPKVELTNGIRLDTNYYYWPEAWILNRPGYFTGSGMPMRFADLDGSMIDVYQAATQMTDESGIDYSLHINTLLDNALGANGYYGVVTTNMHTDSGNHAGQQTVVNAALARGVPVVSAAQMLTWLDGRNGSSFEDLTWNAGTLTFSILAAAGSNGLETMLPTRGPNGSLQTLTLGGTPASFTTQTIKGVEYAIFPAAAGTYAATYGSDTTAPAISSVLAVPGADGTASVTWTTDEPATSRVDYGTTADVLSSNVEDAALATAHHVVLTGLDPNTTYFFRVTSADAANLTSVSPSLPDNPTSFATPGAVATDTTVADFAAGTTGTSTSVSDTTGGEVILAPAVGAEFQGPGIPPAWSTGPWTGGTSTVANGRATVDGSWIRADDLVGTGRAIEFSGTFSGNAFQNAGFGVTLEDTNDSWAMFGTNTTPGTLRARTLVGGGTPDDFELGSQYIGSKHLFRIEWDSTAVRFYIDGTLVHTAATVSGTMRPIASDYQSGDGALSIDWMRMTPYASAGTFLSRIHDAGSSAAWGAISYDANVPSGTTLALSVRTGSTPTPDGAWTAFSPVTQGQVIGGSSRYLQYRAQATSAGSVTPTLSSVTIPYSATIDTTAPAIIGRTPAPNSTQIALGTNVNVVFDEPINPTTITTSTVTLRADGASTNVPAIVTYAGTTATLDPIADLATTTEYTVTVAGSLADTAGNPLEASDAWTFTTSAPQSNIVDTTAADFGAGSTGANTYVSVTDNGEVSLMPTVGAEFQGTTLPTGWVVNPWSGSGGATFAGGATTVDQAAIWTTDFYTPGRVLEFEANFSAMNPHIGFANDFNSGQWAIFSTGPTGDQLYARSSGPGGPEVGLGTGYLNGLHRYRIEWTATSVRYLIDGTQVALHSGLSYGANLRPAASDANSSGSLAINWMRMSPYGAGGTFTSRVLDADLAVDWRSLDVTESTPNGTATTFEVRTGNTPSPDATWSVFTPVTADGDLTGNSRYIQYRVTLSTSVADDTPVVQHVSIRYIAPQDETPPTITAKSPTPNAADVALDTSVSVSFSEAVDAATVASSSVHLQRDGTDVGATLHVNGSSVILVPDSALEPHTTYTAGITTAVTDLAGNHLT
ncbi:MAG: Ig-like domain-containing protein, partial [Ilumatobacteraceae bacterium]